MRAVCECGKPTDDHTIRELRVCHPAEQLNLPYQAAGGDVIDGGTVSEQGAVAGALVVRALVVSIPDGPAIGLPRSVPAIGWTFFGPDGLTEVARTVLVLDDERMRALRTLIGSAIDNSIRLARRSR